MKLCVSARQERKYLNWAEQIIFEYRDRNAIPDFIEKYPDKTIILNYFDFEEIDWDELQTYKILSHDNFLLATNDLDIISDCTDNQINFYIAYPISTYDELIAVVNLGSKYVRLGAPLFFDLDNIHKFFPDLKIRLVPNIAYDDGYIRENGVAGTWVRPEDIMMYDPYVDTIEFHDIDSHKERALINIYWENRAWPGSLNMLITNLNYEGLNRLLPSMFTETRLNCQQKCVSRKSCHACFRLLHLANKERLLDYQQSLEPKNTD